MSRGVLATLGLGALVVLGGAGIASAQTVTAPSAASPCLENTAQDQFACGDFSVATGTKATAVGDHAEAPANSASAFGQNTLAYGENGTAIGRNAHAIADNSTAVGVFTDAQGSHTTAVGVGAEAGVDGDFLPDDPTTFGGFGFATAIGAESDAKATNATALGSYSAANAENATAVGQGANANFANSAAFGQGVSTTRENQQSFGSGSTNYTMAGINSDSSKGFQSGPTYVVTSDASGNLATTSFSVDQITNQLDELGEGVAMAMAMGGLQVPAGRTFAISGSVGFFDGSTAAAFAAAARLADTESISAVLNAGVGVGFETGVVGGTVGLTLAW